jgi:polysaccharide deacetylase 2 family uncharacterized protein YibQ
LLRDGPISACAPDQGIAKGAKDAKDWRMTADDLSAPLGQDIGRRRKLPRMIVGALPQAIGAALALFLGVFLVWAIVADDPFGGEPMVAVPIDPRAPMAPKKPMAEAPDAAVVAPMMPGTTPGLGRDGASAAAGSPASASQASGGPVTITVPPAAGSPANTGAANTRTITIIDGKTGARQDVVIPAEGKPAASPDGASLEQKFIEMTPHGPIPQVSADGVRPAEAFAQPVKPIPGKPDAPRVALIIGGLGVSTSLTSDAIGKLPAAVTLAFMPYAYDVDHLAGRARRAGHEVLLQAPMEPFGYPDNDSGPQTLLTSLTPEQNLERLYWLMSRFHGYVGIVGAMGARFTASEPAFAPILQETTKRGLIFVDDGANPRSVAARIAGASSLPFAKADIIIDSVPTPVEIDHALGRLELAARERGVAIGISSALPVSIEHVATWAKGAEARGVQLVPITAVALKPKQSLSARE